MTIHLNNPYRPGNTPRDIDGIVDSDLVSWHHYYDFIPHAITGWDPSGALHAQGKQLVRVTGFAQMTGCTLGLMVENEQPVPNNIYVGYHPPAINGDVTYRQSFYRTASSSLPELGHVTVNLGSETFQLAAFDGTIDFSGPSGTQKTYGPKGHDSFVVAFDTTDAGLLSFFDTHPVTVYSRFTEHGGSSIQSDLPTNIPPTFDTLIENIQATANYMFLRYYYT